MLSESGLMGNKVYDYHGWSITYPAEIQVFAADEKLVVTSVDTRWVLGQIAYCPKQQGLKVVCPRFDLGFRVKNKELSLFLSGYELQFP